LENVTISTLVYSNIEEIKMKKKEVEQMTISESCPKCNYNKLKYNNVQIRSADEGSTIFYECLKCHHKFTVNN
jgi:DNA-directed RNA polymerase I subunit RPA12